MVVPNSTVNAGFEIGLAYANQRYLLVASQRRARSAS